MRRMSWRAISTVPYSEALSRVVDNELEAYAALAATLSAATLRLPLAAAVVEWSDFVGRCRLTLSIPC